MTELVQVEEPDDVPARAEQDDGRPVRAEVDHLPERPEGLGHLASLCVGSFDRSTIGPAGRPPPRTDLTLSI